MYYNICESVSDWESITRGPDGQFYLLSSQSMSAKGKDFGQSIAEMNFVAGEYFGQNRKGINLKRSTDDSDVKIGEVEVIDVPTN